MKTTIKGLAPFLVAGAFLAAAAGCQLIVDFDRTLIDAGAVDASIDINKPDNSVADTGNDVVTTNDGGDGSTSDASDGSTSDASDAATTDAAGDADDGSADAASE